MKKYYFIFIFLGFFAISKAQFVDIGGYPTSGILMGMYPGCFNANQEMDTTCPAIVNEDTLILKNMGVIGFNTSCIQYFKNLKYLDLSQNDFGGLGYFPATLETLICGEQSFQGAGGNIWDGFHIGGYLQYLGNLPAGLRELDIRASSLVSWPVWPPDLESLNISANELNTLPPLPGWLKKLDCSRQAQGVGFVGSTWANLILDTIISLPPGLTHLNCSYTSLTALPPLPSSLIYLDCSHTNFWLELCTTSQCVPFYYYTNVGITSLPNLPPNLEYLDVSENHINFAPEADHIILPTVIPPTIIDLSAELVPPGTILPPGLKHLETGPRTTCLPYLPASLAGQSPYRSIPYNLVLQNPDMCIPNVVPGLILGQKGDNHTYPIVYNALTKPYCNILNNTNNCISDPSITGFVFYDLNSNGIQDPGENPRGGVKVINDNGVVGFSGIDGVYAAQGHLGNNVTTITPPPFYNAVPASINHTLNTADTLVRDTVALQPNVIIDSMRITITPMNVARSGWYIPYHIKYENVGTTTVNANIVINYNSSILAPAGGPLTLSLNNVGPGDRGEFYTNFVVSSSAAIGAEVHTTATITAGTSTCIDHSYLNVIASYDPNDKHATPTLTAEQVSSGAYIDYLVRFQNTGNDTAFNITITDKLDANLVANTLQIIEASHACTATQINEYVNFKFSNILLPDSNVNEPASHGYIRFRIKPQPGLPNNTNVPNNAAIYFDFNSPVITNDAITIVNLATVPLTILDFSGMVQPENKVLLSWKTANEINTARYDIEQGNDGRKFTMVASVPAVGRGDNNYSQLLSLPEGIVYYRLKITDIDGRISYSNVIKISGGRNKAGFVLLNNPVKNEININLLDNSLVNTNASIISSQGIIVKTFTLTSGIQHIDVSSLPTGLYFIRTKNGTEKMVKSE